MKFTENILAYLCVTATKVKDRNFSFSSYCVGVGVVLQIPSSLGIIVIIFIVSQNNSKETYN